MLIIVTLGGIIIFLVLVMLALLNVKLCFQRAQAGEMDSLLLGEAGHDGEETPIFTIDRNFKGETEQFTEELYHESDESAAQVDVENDNTPSFDISQFCLKNYRYTRRFFR